MNISEKHKIESVWTCPRCGREFGEAQVAHDCRGRSRAEYAATTLFASSAPHVYDLFLQFAEMVAALGPVEIKIERVRIDFWDEKVFILVHAEREAMLASMIFADLDNQPRFISIERLDDGSWLHTLRVAKPSDLDAELAGWVQQARREVVGALE